MYLGIEIGGTKLQLAVGSGEVQNLIALERLDVVRSQAAEGIRHQICDVGRRLIEQHQVRGVGIGFGGPVRTDTGRVIQSFQIDGWDDFPIVDWCEDTLQRPCSLGNDADMAGLGEARLGAGRGNKVVFYSNVGSGIGGSLVIDGQLYLGGSGVACDIGHFRPGVEAEHDNQTVESISSGWGMAAVARSLLTDRNWHDPAAVQDLLDRCGNTVDSLDGRMLAAALAQGNSLAQEVFRQGIRAYGWALAQAITLLGPNVVVIGGGVPLIGEALYLNPLRKQIQRYVFPPMLGTYEIQPAVLGEQVVLFGALALAADSNA